jgi:hypothetical protein
MRNLKTAILATVLMGAATTANAAVLFSDNFDSYPAMLAITSSLGTNWTVTGNVDTVATINPYGIGACAGICLDLDGTTGPGQILSKPIFFAAGKQVFITFDVSGNQRGGSPDTFFFEGIFGAPLTYNVNVLTGFTFGNTGIFTNASTGTYTESIVAGRPYVTYTFGYIPTVAGSHQLRFGTTSADNIGPILDNVVVSQVPEPASWAMLITGFGMVGLAARRRRIAVAA